MNNSASSICGVVLAGDSDQQAQLRLWLADFAQVQHTNFVADENALRTHLSTHCTGSCHRRPAFIIVVVNKNHPVVPACVLRYPDAQILVLTRSRKTGDIDGWAEQGAHDVASLKKPDDVRRALHRLMRQCDTARQLHRLAEHNNELQHDVAAMQQQRMHGIQAELAGLCNGLPDRHAMTAGIDRLLSGVLTHQRYFVALISVPSDGDDEQTELHLYRIANQLQAELSTDMLLGAVASNRLLLIQPESNVKSAKLAVLQVRSLLKKQHNESALLCASNVADFQLHATTVQANTCTADQITDTLIARAQSVQSAPRAKAYTSSTTDATV